MMKFWGMEIQLHILSMEMSGHLHSHYGCPTTRVRAPVILRIGWVDSTASLDAVVKRKVSISSGNQSSFFGHHARSPPVTMYTDCTVLADTSFPSYATFK